MRRPLPVTILTIVESLVGIAGLCFGAYLLRLSLRPDMAKDAADAHGLRVAGALFAVPGVLWIALAVLVFLGFRWAWWIGVTLNLAMAVALGMDVVDEWHSSGADDIALAATFVLLTALHLMPSVWRFRRKAPLSSQDRASAVGA